MWPALYYGDISKYFLIKGFVKCVLRNGKIHNESTNFKTINKKKLKQF